MKLIFADTVFWIAIFFPNDPWAAAAKRADVSGALLVTTEEVLAEFLAAASGSGERMRRLACRLVREILADSGIRVIEQSHESFLAGLTLYEKRPDKQYSLTDCISMNVMRQMKITGILTQDRHFAQEGFVRLMARKV